MTRIGDTHVAGRLSRRPEKKSRTRPASVSWTFWTTPGAASRGGRTRQAVWVYRWRVRSLGLR